MSNQQTNTTANQTACGSKLHNSMGEAKQKELTEFILDGIEHGFDDEVIGEWVVALGEIPTAAIMKMTPEQGVVFSCMLEEVRLKAKQGEI